MPVPPPPVPPVWAGLVDDAAIFPPGDAELADAVAAFEARRTEWYAALVGSFVVTDQRLPEVGADLPLSVVLTSGAGAVDGVARWCERRGTSPAGLEVALRDLDDLAGNARRVVAAVEHAQAEGLLDDVPVHVELPQGDVTHGWAAAADVVAEAGHRLKFRTGGVEAHLFPTAAQVAAWIDAALDRETTFKCTAGLHHAVRHRDAATGFEHHGFLNVLLATARADAAAGTDEVAAALETTDRDALLALAAELDFGRARRWFTSFGSCSVTEPLDDLLALGLLEAPR